MNSLTPAQLVARGIEGRGDAVVDTLLPVLRARSSAPCAHIVGRGQIKWTERGAVRHLRKRLRGKWCERRKEEHERDERRGWAHAENLARGRARGKRAGISVLTGR